MARINLLPWREASRQRRRQRSLRMLVAAVLLGAGMTLLADLYIEGLIERQQLRNQYLGQANELLDKQIASIQALEVRRQQLLERMDIIEALQDGRSVGVQVFEQLARSLPDGVYFTAVDRQGARLSIAGVAESNSRVSDLMRNLQSAEGFSAPSLTEVTHAAGAEQGLSNLFRLSVERTPLLAVEIK
ncbi:PilN domain-containing protein [Pseudomonas sp. LD120]|uniref:PilN domain-containing protein n=1 Tax=Pseudomonas sp. LD120 TaxID=485751 RepID=UPI0013590255|nr:PilN domain-containing protein [Pseudomonas sp. LD120]KAF0862480.1 pilus assembly protein PilN [Pseudomonas sp. LD120]